MKITTKARIKRKRKNYALYTSFMSCTCTILGLV